MKDNLCYIDIEDCDIISGGDMVFDEEIMEERQTPKCLLQDKAWLNHRYSPDFYNRQCAFKKKHNLSDKEFMVVSTLSTLPVFPRLLNCPYQAYKLTDYVIEDLYALMKTGLKWVDHYGKPLTLCMPNIGYCDLTHENLTRMSFEVCNGVSTEASHIVRRVDVDFDGVVHPIVRSNKGVSYIFEHDILRCNIIEGYDGNMLERVGTTYYGFGKGRPYINRNQIKYVDLLVDTVNHANEGYIVHYELLASKLVRKPTIDVVCKDGVGYDRSGKQAVVIAPYDQVHRNLDGKVVSCDTTGHIVSDVYPSVPSPTCVVDTAKRAVDWDEISSLVAPCHVRSFDIRGVSDDSLQTLLNCKDQVLPRPFRRIVWRPDVTYTEFLSIVRRYVSRGRFRSTSFVSDLKRKGIFFDYECLLEYLGWCGFYRIRGQWFFDRIRILTRPLCRRIYDASCECTCSSWRKGFAT